MRTFVRGSVGLLVLWSGLILGADEKSDPAAIGKNIRPVIARLGLEGNEQNLQAVVTYERMQRFELHAWGLRSAVGYQGGDAGVVEVGIDFSNGKGKTDSGARDTALETSWASIFLGGGVNLWSLRRTIEGEGDQPDFEREHRVSLLLELAYRQATLDFKDFNEQERGRGFAVKAGGQYTWQLSRQTATIGYLAFDVQTLRFDQPKVVEEDDTQVATNVGVALHLSPSANSSLTVDLNYSLYAETAFNRLGVGLGLFFFF